MADRPPNYSCVLMTTAASLDGDHIGLLASAAWRDVWMTPVRIATFESVWRTNADGSQALIQRTIRFRNGTSITTGKPSELKMRIYE